MLERKTLTFLFTLPILACSTSSSDPAPTGPEPSDDVVQADIAEPEDVADIVGPGPADTPEPDAGPPDADPVDAGPQDTGPEDAGPEDTGPEDTGPEDTGPEDTGPEDTGPVGPTCAAYVEITAPAADTFHLTSAGVTLEATVTSDAALDTLKVQWSTAAGVTLGVSDVQADGTTSFASGALGPDDQKVVAAVHNADGACEGVPAEHTLLLCNAHVVENFDAALDPAIWQVNGSGSWDSGGWLELTGTVKGQLGQIVNVVEYVAKGHAQMRVDLATGGGSDPGADGFAMTIFETDTVAELESVIATAISGRGLGYGVSGTYGPWTGKALTVEIDTWYNKFNGTTEKHTDPTEEDHLELTLDGDPGNSLAWTAVSDVEDLQWRTVEIRVLPGKVQVRIDGVLSIDQVIDLDFRGGYIVFSGSTGYYTNFHRVDNLDILHDCK